MAAASEITAVEKTTPALRKVEFHLARKPISFNPNVNPNFKLETLNPNSSFKSALVPCSQSSSSSAAAFNCNSRRADHSDFFEDAVLAFRMPLRRIGAGLENLGNTCFLNSVIQCLTYTEPLVGYLQSGKHQTTCRVAGFCALCAIQKHVSRALQASGRILAPKDLVSNLRCISRNFRNARQEDAHEYMIHLLESMHKCCLPSGVQAESPGAYEKSLVHRIFGGRLRSQVKCLQCSYCSNTFDPFLDLSLEIVKADTLYKALRHFTAPEQLDGGERQYKCEKCKQKVRALKQLTISKAPYVLTVHLKRFRSHFSGQKIDKKVQFGSTLDLKPFVTGEYEGDLTYTLYGVLVHAGWSTHSGHYYSFVRTSNGIWYSLDDNRVIQVSERIVMEQKAYMLFYVRDRKKFIPKKTMDIVQRESMITTIQSIPRVSNAAGEKNTKETIQSIPSVSNAAAEKNTKETIQPGSVLKHIENSKTSEVVVQPNSLRSLKQESNDRLLNMSSESSVLEKDNLSIPKANIDEMVHSAKSADDSVKNSVVATIGAGSDSYNEPKSDPGLLNEKPSGLGCSSSVASAVDDLASDKVKNDKPVTSGPSDSTIEGNSESKEVKNVASAVDDLASDKVKNDKPVTSGPSDSTIEGNSESKEVKNVKASKSSIKKQSVDKSKSHDVLRRGLVKKIFKCRAVGSHLSTKLLYGAALKSMKKRKCKKMKKLAKLALDENLLSGSAVLANTKSSIAVASTSVENHYSTDSVKTAYDSCSRENAFKDTAIDSNSISPLLKSDEALKSSVRGAGLGNGKLPKESISVEAQPQVVVGSYAEQSQNGISKETPVLRWEGVESPSENAQDNGSEVVTIGHVLDEWDEEYDRGKRKKVREFRHEFGGPNVFQQISSKKAKLKAKTERRISTNEPFRI